MLRLTLLHPDYSWAKQVHQTRVTVVIPGCASWHRAGIHTPDGGYGFRARSLSDKIDIVNFAQSSRPGMTNEIEGVSMSKSLIDLIAVLDLEPLEVNLFAATARRRAGSGCSAAR
jgi:hypothetical protein